MAILCFNVDKALEYFDLNCEDKVLGSKSLHDLFGTANELNEEIRIHGSYHKTKSSDTRKLEELMSVGYLVQAIRARRIFEIGTFVGRMTRILAINAEQAEVLTIDLPQNSVPHNVGEDYVNTKERARITQLYGDSSHFDFSAWKDQIDFCWVDACHDYEFVMADTRAAFMMVRDGGWIAWHDYRHTAWWSGVTKAVWRCHREMPT